MLMNEKLTIHRLRGACFAHFGKAVVKRYKLRFERCLFSFQVVMSELWLLCCLVNMGLFEDLITWLIFRLDNSNSRRYFCGFWKNRTRL